MNKTILSSKMGKYIYPLLLKQDTILIEMKDEDEEHIQNITEQLKVLGMPVTYERMAYPAACGVIRRGYFNYEPFDDKRAQYQSFIGYEIKKI